MVQVHSDNEAAVAVVNAGYSKDPQMMHLIYCLFFVLAAWDISLYACHIPGVLNPVADAISWDIIPLLFSKGPDANRNPAPIPNYLVELLLTCQPDWTLPSQKQLLAVVYSGLSCIHPQIISVGREALPLFWFIN